MRAWLSKLRIGAVVFALAAPNLVHAVTSPGETQRYGAFSLNRVRIAKGSRCTLVVDYAPAGETFVLWMVQDDERLTFIGYYVTSLGQLRGKSVSLQIDHREFLRFDPSLSAASSRKIVSLHIDLSGDFVQRTLTEAAENAQLFEVVAGDFRWSVPLDGLKAAMAEYAGCRHERWM